MPLFLFGCEAECCLRQMQRGGARAKQRETKQSAGFDCVLPMEQEKKRRKKRNLRKIREIGILPISLVVFPYCHPTPPVSSSPSIVILALDPQDDTGAEKHVIRFPSCHPEERSDEGPLNGDGLNELLFRGMSFCVQRSFAALRMTPGRKRVRASNNSL